MAIGFDDLAPFIRELREEHRIKLAVDYAYVRKYNELRIACHEIWRETIAAVAEKHGLKVLEWLEWGIDNERTCGCGLYVHPSRRNLTAIHCADCEYANERGTDLSALLVEWYFAAKVRINEFSGDIGAEILALVESAERRYALHGARMPEAVQSDIESMRDIYGSEVFETEAEYHAARDQIPEDANDIDGPYRDSADPTEV